MRFDTGVANTIRTWRPETGASHVYFIFSPTCATQLLSVRAGFGVIIGGGGGEMKSAPGSSEPPQISTRDTCP